MLQTATFLIFHSVALKANESQCPANGPGNSVHYLSSTLTLKILLVQFTDVTCKKYFGSIPKFSKADFEDALGSDGVYVSPNRTTPDGDVVYGSLHDYFRKMSSGNLMVNAVLLNNLDDDLGLPVWLNLPGTKHSYDAGDWWDFYRAVLDAATASGINIGTLGDLNKLAIVYAGNRYNNYSLNPQVPYIGADVYTMSELENSPFNQEHGGAKFSRIGTHCHEFAHTLGINHSCGSRADVMEAGNRNGNYAAPAPINPVSRWLKGWLTPTLISGQQQFDAHYSLESPQIFRINSNANGDYFFVENRKFNQSMVIGSYSLHDYNHSDFMPIASSSNSTNVIYPQGVLVWRVRYYYPDGNYEGCGLLYASGRYGATWPDSIPSETDAGDLFPGTRNVTWLTPWSDRRNPYEYVEDEGRAHYSLCDPNTKAGTNAGMHIISENPSAGTFSIDFFSSGLVDPAVSNQSTVTSAIRTNSQRKLVRSPSGTLFETFENGGEVYVRRSDNGGVSWSVTSLISSGAGASGYSSLAAIGSTLLVSWQQEYRVDQYPQWNRYQVVRMCRSTDAGATWQPMSVVQDAIPYVYPGPLPALSCYNDGSVFLTYLGPTALNSWKSTNAGTSWVSVPDVPGSSGAANMPSVSINTTYWSTSQANVVFASDVVGGSPRIKCNYYDFQTSAWGSSVDLCSILPAQYSQHANPSLAVSADESYKTVHVAWDADDTNPGNKVIIHRKGGFRSFPSVYSVLSYQGAANPSITGISQEKAWVVYQNASGNTVWKRYYDGSNWNSGAWVANGFSPQISVGSTGARYLWMSGSSSPYQINLSGETLSKTGDDLAYSRALNVIDTLRKAFVALELAPGRAVTKAKQILPLALSDVAGDSTEFGMSELQNAGSSIEFALPSDADTLYVPVAVYGIGAEKLFTNGGSVGLSIVNSNSGNVLLRAFSISGSSIGKKSKELEELQVPVAQIALSSKGARLKVKPEFAGIRSDLAPVFSVGHIYKQGSGATVAKPGSGEPIASATEKPTSFDLQQNYPNPFNPSTSIDYRLPKDGKVSLSVYDQLGREVKELVSGFKSAGRYAVQWNASGVSSGLYYARFIVLDEFGKVQFSKVNKLLLTK